MQPGMLHCQDMAYQFLMISESLECRAKNSGEKKSAPLNVLKLTEQF